MKTPITILGDAMLDADGILHGWCWSPERGDARLGVDILINGVVVAHKIAARWHEDGLSDGFHGFEVAITLKLSQAPAYRVVTVREHDTATCLWQQAFGALALPAGEAAALSATAQIIEEIRRSPALLLADRAKTGKIAAAFAGFGARLHARP